MDCQHRIEHGKLMRCAIAPGVTFPLVGARGNPCEVCQRSWRNGQPPTADRPPLHLAVASRGLTVLAAKPGQKTITRPALTPMEKARKFLAAFARYVKSGGKLTDKPTRAARLAICAECPERGKLLLADVCNRCGCFVSIKSKMETEHCPLGKWENGKRPKKSSCNGCG